MRRVAVGLVAAGLAVAPAAQAKFTAGVARDLPGGVAVAHAARGQAAALAYNGGPVLHFNRTHVIFWQPSGSGLEFEPGYISVAEAFLANVAADSHKASNIFGLTGQYTDSSGRAVYDSRYGGPVIDDDPLPRNGCIEPPVTGPGWTVCLTDDQLSAEIQHVVFTHHLPTNWGDLYFLVTPKGLGSCVDTASTSCALGGALNGYCGYHSQAAAGTILYAIIPYNAVAGHCQSNNPRPNSNPADPALSTLSHEHNEMITDPADDAWTDSSGNENGDLCISSFGPAIGGSGSEAYNESINGGHYFLQEEWSNADGGCRQRASADSAHFSVRHAAGHRVVTLMGSGTVPGRQVVAYRWFFGDGRGGSGRQVTHRFARPGTYKVMLRAIDAWGNWGLYARAIRAWGTRR